MICFRILLLQKGIMSSCVIYRQESIALDIDSRKLGTEEDAAISHGMSMDRSSSRQELWRRSKELGTKSELMLFLFFFLAPHLVSGQEGEVWRRAGCSSSCVLKCVVLQSPAREHRRL